MFVSLLPSRLTRARNGPPPRVKYASRLPSGDHDGFRPVPVGDRSDPRAVSEHDEDLGSERRRGHLGERDAVAVGRPRGTRTRPAALFVRLTWPVPSGFMVQMSPLRTKAILPFAPGKAASLAAGRSKATTRTANSARLTTRSLRRTPGSLSRTQRRLGRFNAWLTSLTEVPFNPVRSFVRLLGFLRPHLRGVVWSLVLSCLAIAGTVAIPLLLGEVVNAIERAATATRCSRCRWRSSAPASCGSRSPCPRRLISGKVSLGVEYDLRNRLYRHLQSLELGFFDRQQTGQLMSRATVDLQSVRFFLGYGLIFILQNLLTILLAAVVMFVLQPSLAAITLAPVPLVILAAARYGRHSRPALQEVQQRIGELTAEAEESISGIRVVKAFAREEERRAELHPQGHARVRPEHVLDPAARVLQPDDLVPAEPRAGRGAARRRPPGRERLDQPGRVRHLQHLSADADVPDADARHRARHGAARGGVGQPRVRAARPRAAPGAAAAAACRCLPAAAASASTT